MDDEDADGDAFVRRMYDASYRRLVGQLVGVTGDLAEAEDVVQEAFVRAIGHARSFARTDNPEAWLRRVAVNVARTRYRRAHSFLRLAPRLAETRRQARYDDLPEDRLTLVEALRRLPPAQREAVTLHHLADLPVHEVAETLGVPLGTVKARLSRGRAALATLLAEPHDGTTAEKVRHA